MEASQEDCPGSWLTGAQSYCGGEEATSREARDLVRGIHPYLQALPVKFGGVFFGLVFLALR